MTSLFDIFPRDSVILMEGAPLRNILFLETFPLDSEHRAYGIAAPGKVLTQTMQEAILNTFEKISKNAFQDAHVDEYWKQRRADNYFSRLDELFLIHDQKEIVGFFGFAVLTGSGPTPDAGGYVNFYLDTGALLKKAQARKLTPILFRKALVDGVFNRDGYRNVEHLYATTSTQNPIVYESAKDFVVELFPNEEKLEITDMMWKCVQDLVRWQGGDVGRSAADHPRKGIYRDTLIEYGDCAQPFYTKAARENLAKKAGKAFEIFRNPLFENVGDRDELVLIGAAKRE